jgi:hypothetical protein
MRRPPGHRPQMSDEERRRREAKMRAQKAELDIFADPSDPKRLLDKPHRRRNSESSVRGKPLDPEEEKKRRERKHRESKSRGKPQKRLDVIDKLDVTSIYGTGCKSIPNSSIATTNSVSVPPRWTFRCLQPTSQPQGFPQSPNASIPSRLAQYASRRFGTSQQEDRYRSIPWPHNRDADYVRRPLPERTTSFNPTSRDIVHGNESAGLGTSTFLDGAPASKKAIEEGAKEAAEQQQQMQLSRKKSLAQRFTRRDRSNTLENRINGRKIQGPDGLLTPTTPLDTAKSENGANPFFQNYDQEYEKKGAAIAFAEEQNKGRARASSSPRREMPAPLERTKTADSTGLPDEPRSAGDTKSGGGFLSRMKSLKTARKPRPERRDTSG